MVDTSFVRSKYYYVYVRGPEGEFLLSIDVDGSLKVGEAPDALARAHAYLKDVVPLVPLEAPANQEVWARAWAEVERRVAFDHDALQRAEDRLKTLRERRAFVADELLELGTEPDLAAMSARWQRYLAEVDEDIVGARRDVRHWQARTLGGSK